MICNHTFREHARFMDGTTVFMCSQCSQQCSSLPMPACRGCSAVPLCDEVTNEAAEPKEPTVAASVARMNVAVTANQSSQLVGTKLHEVLAECGINPPTCGPCKQWVDNMNNWGISGCQEKRPEIIARLDSEAKKASWIQWAKVAAKGYLSSSMLLDEALKRCGYFPSSSSTSQSTLR